MNVIRPRPVDDPAIRLAVFHHAGGSAAAYFPLIHGIPATWDLLLVDLPGHGKRYRSPPLRDMRSLVAVATEDVMAWAGPPIALFGHSLGAVLAAEVARSMQRTGTPPVWVGVSGRPAPGQHMGGHDGLAELPDTELMQRLIAIGGVPERIDEAPGFRRRFLELIRSDLHAVASFQPDPGREPLTAPLTAFGATDDHLAPPSTTVLWQGETSATFRHRVFSGGHFYFLGAAFQRFAEVVAEEIRWAVRQAPSAAARPAGGRFLAAGAGGWS
jgi:surfactin synthase thioesterase subunit